MMYALVRDEQGSFFVDEKEDWLTLVSTYVVKHDYKWIDLSLGLYQALKANISSLSVQAYLRELWRIEK